MSTPEIHDDITNSDPRPAVLYARVSSKEQEQGYSIQAQKDALHPYAAPNGLVVDKEFGDVASATKPGRPGFNAMLHYLRNNPRCRVILVEKTDRLYRNFEDSVEVNALVDQLGVKVHLVKEGLIYNKASGAADKYRHGLDVLNAKRYSDNLSEEVQKGLRTKAAQGLWPSFAPLGYRNATGDDGTRIIVPDAVMGTVVTQLFNWFATGEYSLRSLAQLAYEAGFRFRKSGSKVPASTLHKTLRKRIFMGEFDYGGVRYQGCHAPLVTREVWERVQEVLDGRHRKSPRRGTHEFAYSGMVKCGHCGCALVAEVKKGRYIYYHCTGYRGKCREPYTREATLQAQFALNLQELRLPPEIVRWMEAALIAFERNAQAGYVQLVRHHQEELERLQRRHETMYDDRLDGRIDAAAFDQRSAQIQVQREQIQQRIQSLQKTMPDQAGQTAVDLEHVLSQVDQWFPEQSAREKRRLLRLVVQKASWKDGALQISMRAPYPWLRQIQPATADQSKMVIRQRR